MSDAYDAWKETVSTQKRFITDAEIQHVKSIVDPFMTMCNQFRGFSAPNYSQSQWEKKASELIALEKEIVHLDFLSYLYPYIGRALLNSKSITRSKTYANAGIELNTHNNDQEGIRSSYMVLIDSAVLNEDYDAALEMMDFIDYDPRMRYEVSRLTSSKKKQKTTKDYLTESRPSSFRYSKGREKDIEGRVRYVQAALPGCSRAEAKRHVNDAIKRGEI